MLQFYIVFSCLSILDTSDLLTGVQSIDTDKSDLELLHEILESNNEFCSYEKWQETPNNSDYTAEGMKNISEASCFLPSHFLDMNLPSSTNQSSLKGTAFLFIFLIFILSICFVNFTANSAFEYSLKL